MQPRIEGVDAARAMYANLKAKGASDNELLLIPELADVMALKNTQVESDELSFLVRQRLCYAIVGVTQVGKSWMVRRVCEHLGHHLGWKTYRKDQGTWWQHYNREEIIIFNEYDASYSYQHFKLLIDGDRFICDIKGTSAIAPVRVVILCTNKPLETWYPRVPEGERAAVFSRIKKKWMMTARSDQREIGQDLLTHMLYDIREVEHKACQIEFEVDAHFSGTIRQFMEANKDDPFLTPLLKTEDLVSSKLRAIKEKEERTGVKIKYVMLKDVQQHEDLDEEIDIASIVSPSERTATLPLASPQQVNATPPVYEFSRPPADIERYSSDEEMDAAPVAAQIQPFVTPAASEQTRPPRADSDLNISVSDEYVPGPNASPFTVQLAIKANRHWSATRRSLLASINSSVPVSSSTPRRNKQDPIPCELQSSPPSPSTPKAFLTPNSSDTATPTATRSPPPPDSGPTGQSKTKLTPPFLQKARIEQNMVIWINRYSIDKENVDEVKCERKYFQVTNKEQMKLFLSLNTQAIADGTCTVDEVCVHDQQKMRLDIDGTLTDFEGVSDDFTAGSHVELIVSVANCESLTMI